MQKRIIPYVLLAGVFFLLVAPAVHADDASEWYVKGQNAAIVGNYEQALQYYDNALAADKNYISAQSGRAFVLNQLRRYDEALAAADLVLAVKKDPVAAEAGAFALYSLGRYDESVTAYDLFFTLRQNIPEAYCNQGRAYQQLGNSTEALDSFERCVKLDPMNLDGWNQQGLIYLSLGEYDDALDAFNHCTRITLTNATVWNNKGLAYAGLEDYPDALNCFKTALNLDPTFEEARKNIDKAYARKPFFTPTMTSIPVTVTPVPAESTPAPAEGSTTNAPLTTIPATSPTEGVSLQETASPATTYAPLPLPVAIAGIISGAGICLLRNQKK